MNLMLPDQFVRIPGANVKVAIYDICPLREDYAVAPVVLSVLRDLARDTGIVIEYSDDLLNEVTLSDKRIADALVKTDADLLVFGSYVATRSSVQPMIHIVCTYGRAMEPSAGLPDGVDLNQAIQEGDAILQLPRHVLIREVLPVMEIESLDFQNRLAEELFHIAQFIQALKLYKAEKFEETTQTVGAILAGLESQDEWPSYWAPYSYLNMLGGLAYLRMGNAQAAAYTLSDAIPRSTPAKMRVQRCAEEILASLMQQPQEGGSESETPSPASEPAGA